MEGLILSKLQDMTGMRFGRLTVVQQGGDYVLTTNGRHRVRWLCKCDCGNSCLVMRSSLIHKDTQSCGCLKSDNGKIFGIENFKHSPIGKATHGKSGTRLYNVWKGMKKRCYNSSEKYYCNYGGRNIAVCDEWKNCFDAFYEWAMSNGYDPNAPRGKCTIDRINNDGNYEPQNCRWVDVATQNKNQQRTKNREK